MAPATALRSPKTSRAWPTRTANGGFRFQFHEYKGLDHGQSFAPFSAEALAFLTARLHGLPVANGCSSIGAGNALTPLSP